MTRFYVVKVEELSTIVGGNNWGNAFISALGGATEGIKVCNLDHGSQQDVEQLEQEQVRGLGITIPDEEDRQNSYVLHRYRSDTYGVNQYDVRKCRNIFDFSNVCRDSTYSYK